MNYTYSLEKSNGVHYKIPVGRAVSFENLQKLYDERAPFNKSELIECIEINDLTWKKVKKNDNPDLGDDDGDGDTIQCYAKEFPDDPKGIYTILKIKRTLDPPKSALKNKKSGKKSGKKSSTKSTNKSAKKNDIPTMSDLLKLAEKYNVTKSGTKTEISKRIYSLRSIYLSLKERNILENFLHIPENKKEKRERKKLPVQ